MGVFFNSMYELQEHLQAYYDELDPKKRLEILDSLHEDTNYLHAIYQNRYSDHENKGRKNVDWWLWRCICLHQLYGRGKIFRGFRDREINAIITELCMDDNEQSHMAMLYYEYRNVCRRYLSTCKSGNYASSFMGFKRASDEQKVLRACSDIWQMSKGVALSVGVEDKMHLWIEAFHDELMNYDSVCHAEYERLDSNRRKK